MTKSNIMLEERALEKVWEEKALAGEALEPIESGLSEAKAQGSAGCLHFICSRE